ncbi:homoserine O-acetyltransferase MetX [Microvirga rosea]|uniref:homoserine O-acetyltransferase MetX n=1 Tax=Microvirga rosea TaxID=2715425 RepID=UPI001D0A6BA3|nr:homoserine O-acetyltransferase [Microvirga rosea]MCB8822130.1 homoserine O-acetyltransferase [Microvirga rosea]
MKIARETVRLEEPLGLTSGNVLPQVDLAFETYGTLSPDRDNAVLLLHGLTADQHAAGPPWHQGGRAGWWSQAIGPGLAIDTDRFFVICPNVIGSFGGSTGPMSPDPTTGRPYGMRFPVITIADMVAAQRQLLNQIGITRLYAVIGGCMGGFQALEWMSKYPDQVESSVLISATARTSTHNTALWSVLRAALTSDPAWNRGDYYDGPPPNAGLGLLAMTGALFWMSRDTLQSKFGLRTIEDRPLRYTLEPEFAIEEFLARVHHNASAGNLDANALIYLTRAIDYFDLSREYGSVAAALGRFTSPLLLVSYSADWRYPPQEMDEIRVALAPRAVPVRHEVLNSAIGHGAFLYDFASLEPLLADFLKNRSQPIHGGDGRST